MHWMYLPEEELWQQPWMVRVLSGPYSDKEKRLFMIIASFGPEGCWMINRTLTDELGCSDNTIRRAIKNLRSGGELIVTGNKGSRRRMYPARAPGIQPNMAGQKV